MRKGVFKNLNNHSLHIDNLILIHQEKTTYLPLTRKEILNSILSFYKKLKSKVLLSIDGKVVTKDSSSDHVGNTTNSA